MRKSQDANRIPREEMDLEHPEASAIVIEDRTVTPSQSNGGWVWLGRFLFRLLLLGFGGTLAVIAGVLFAFAYPQPSSEKPKAIAAWEFLQEKRKELSNNPTTDDDFPNSLPSVSLTQEEKQQLQTQLNSLKTELNALGDRTQEIETRLSLETGETPLSARLQTLQKTLRQATISIGDTAIDFDESSVANHQVKVTLPSDVLFTPQNSLSQEASLILDTIVTDLRPYSGSTVRIAVHTDGTDKPQESRERSFRQARMLQDYLKERLGSNYRWVTVGYGPSRPIVSNDSEGDRQRNRRVEISID